MALYDTSIQWERYLVRPFTLFGASLWYHWYTSDQFKDMCDLVLPDALYVEEPLGTTRSYRDPKQLVAMYEAFKRLVSDEPGRCISMLEEGESLNELASKYIANNPFKSWEEAVEFATTLFVYSTHLPYFSAEFAFTREDASAKRILKLGEKLRSVSFYPRVYKELLVPMVRSHVDQQGVSDISSAAELLTLSEIKAGRFEGLDMRKERRASKDHFIYHIADGKETINWVADVKKLMEKLDGEPGQDEPEAVSGHVAYPGKVSGTTRLVLRLDYKNVEFNNGNILVAMSTNPALMPLMRKCGGIVTDEGGMLSHAAVISRELKKPCIIGTKIATQVLNDGDEVEVDADKGVVKVIKRADE